MCNGQGVELDKKDKQYYYKFSYCKQDFEKLDAFIRQRLRRYITRNKNSKNTSNNLILTNKTLKIMGLKSLIEIYTKYASKNRVIFKKNKQKQIKNGKLKRRDFNIESRLITDELWKKAVLKYLKEITKNIKQIKKKIG